MEGTIEAITTGLTPNLFFDQLISYIPFLLVIVPIAVGMKILLPIFYDLSNAKFIAKADKQEGMIKKYGYIKAEKMKGFY